MNGRLQLETGSFSVKSEQVYANCPRYIQARQWSWLLNRIGKTLGGKRHAVKCRAATTNRLADTFFIASSHADSGADASHRGGFGGFVQVVDDKTLVWPEYNGNGMFNTLRNIHHNARAGLLFVDFDNGSTCS
ncbi:MAG: pyridoxamine 5'-phosphate oxidase family protein [Syntrophotaleaceae bacterium]